MQLMARSIFDMNYRIPPKIARLSCFIFLAGSFSLSVMLGGARPNIVLIYADDIGYGDFSCYGGTGVDTANVDSLAASGIRHLSGYSAAATCTPSRYSLLTGEYAFRNKEAKILPGSAPLIIDTNRPTLASMLKEQGYATALVGKWHLGLGSSEKPMDWNGRIAPGPLQLGFEYAFFMAATGDRVPSVFIENEGIQNLDRSDPVQVSYGEAIGSEPTGISHPHLLKIQADEQHSGTIVNGVSRIGTMTGGKAARFSDETMSDRFLEEALAFIERKKDHPFFLYFAAHENHVPRMPHPRFQGSSSLGLRGDAIMQFDWMVGRIVETLQEQGVYENTLIILTSDNGPVLFDGYWDGAIEKNGDHKPAGPYRGGKYSLYEGGVRAPFIVSWPARVKPGISDAIISQVDLMASLASLLDIEQPKGAGVDGENVLAALLGESEMGRESLVEEALAKVALRRGDWKFIPAGLVTRRGGVGEMFRDPITSPGALYYLREDPGESNNLARVYPEKVKAMGTELERITGRKIISTDKSTSDKQLGF